MQSMENVIISYNTISVKKQLYSEINYSSLNFNNLYAGCMYNIPSIFLSNFLWFGSMRIYPYYIEKLNIFKNKKYDIVGGISGTLASITTDLFVNPIKVLKINKQGNNKKKLKKNISNLYRDYLQEL